MGGVRRPGRFLVTVGCQPDNAIGGLHETLVVRRDNDDPPLVCDVAEELNHIVDPRLIQMRGRLVGDQQRRIEGEGARDGDPLLLASGQTARLVRPAPRHADSQEQFIGPPARSTWMHAGSP